MDDLEIKEGVTIPGWELWFTASRSGGPGGQHANKASSRVTLYWEPATTTAIDDPRRRRLVKRLSHLLTSEGLLQVHAQDERSQHRNRDLAREKLAQIVRNALRPSKRRKRTRVPRSARRRRLENKRQRGDLKQKRQNPSPDDWN